MKKRVVKEIALKMPDASHRREREERLQEAAGEEQLGRGIRYAPNKQSYIVNIRPQKWKDKFKPSKFWKGKIKYRWLAMLFADTIFHYCGKERCHFGDNADFVLPPLQCMGATGLLSTPAERSNYVQSIANSDCHLQRQDFINQVMAVISSPDFILRGERYLGIAPAAEVAHVPAPHAAQAPPAAEVLAVSSSSEECEVDYEEDDCAVAMRAQCASGAQPGASVAWFELDIVRIDRAGRNLKSVQENLGVECFNILDCPLKKDDDWNEAIKELKKRYVMADPTEVFMSNAVDISPVFEIFPWHPDQTS